MLSIDTASGSQSISASDIAQIQSARAFKYNIPDYAGSGAKMSFSATCHHAVASAKVKPEHANVIKTLIIVGLVLGVVAVAVAVPVAVASAHHNHHNNNTRFLLTILRPDRLLMFHSLRFPLLCRCLHRSN